MGVVSGTDFDLAHTLDSGQFFRYEFHEGWYYVVTRQKVFRVQQKGNKLFFEGASERFVKHFLGLDENYKRIKAKLAKDPALKHAIKRYPGLRLLNQDPWECTIGFLCSQFSNIKKIKMNMNCIAALFGEPVRFKGKLFFTFPNPGQINDPRKIQKCAVGYRGKYIAAVNNLVNDKWLAKLKTIPYDQAKEKLMELPGIGEKVADCISLFSLDHTESFPVDVWMERVLKEIYFKKEKMPLKKMAAWARDRWGPFAGHSQQWLYHWRRLQ